jgi:hypothetical protein
VLIGVLLGTSAWMTSGSFVSLPNDPAHVKPVGAMLDESVSGWKINLHFPDIKEEQPLWPPTLPDYLASADDSRARAWGCVHETRMHAVPVVRARPRAAGRARVVEAGTQTIVRSSVFHERRDAHKEDVRWLTHFHPFHIRSMRSNRTSTQRRWRFTTASITRPTSPT